MENNRKLLFFDIDKTPVNPLPMDSSGQCETGFKRSPL